MPPRKRMRLGTDVVSSIQDIVKYMMDIVKSLNGKRITEFGARCFGKA